MKISRKIMISNMTIGFLVTIFLSIMSLFVINSFIRDNVFLNMEKDIARITEVITYRGVNGITDNNNLFEIINLKRMSTTAHVFIILDTDGKLITSSIYKNPEDANEEFYMNLSKSESDRFINVQMGSYPVITYKKNITYIDTDDMEVKLQLIGLVYNSLLYKLLFDMMGPILVALFVVVLFSFAISAILGDKITKPVNVLIEMTKQIGDKQSVISKINSNDEFQIIGKALEDMSEAINFKDLESKQFYEHVSHDLKTPLTIISGYAEGINTGIFDDNREPLEKIVKQCSSLKSQIENVIYLSQLETNRQVFKIEKNSIEEIISKILDDFEVIFIKRDIEVIYQPTKSTFLQLDRDKIIRAINNIVSNGVRHTISKFKIEIIEFDNEVRVVFSDDGPGFSDELLKNPFKGYYSSDTLC